MTHTNACGLSKAKRTRCKCSCSGQRHGELLAKQYLGKVVEFEKMSEELYKKTFGVFPKKEEER